MKVKEITVTCGRKVNLGNYQSGTAEITLTASIEDGEDETGAIDQLQTMARDAIIQELLRMPREVSGPGVSRTPGTHVNPAHVPSGGPQKVPQKPVKVPAVAGPPFQPNGDDPLF